MKHPERGFCIARRFSRSLSLAGRAAPRTAKSRAPVRVCKRPRAARLLKRGARLKQEPKLCQQPGCWAVLSPWHGPGVRLCRGCRADRKAAQRKAVMSGIGGSLSPGTIGAISELHVCADLLLRGYEVFRSVSPTASCDLAVLRGSRLLRIEVKSARLHIKTGTLYHERPEPTRYDHLAVVVNGKVTYIPPLEEETAKVG